MRLSLRLIGVLVVSVLIGSAAVANGLCPFDDQGPLGCPDGTIWYATLEVCLPPSDLTG